MKRYYISFAILAALLILGACEDFLDQKPISELGENGFYTNDREVEAAMIGVYDALQLAAQREFALTEMRSDNTKTRLSEGNWADFEKLNVRTTNDLLATYWGDYFKAIYKANNVLENLDVVQDTDLKAQLEAEVKFVRALGHFNLVRLFKNIPIVDMVISPVEAATVSQAPEADVFNAIVTDLTEAISVLPGRGGIEEGRATKGAAQALLGKVYLTMGSHSSAKTVLEAVISNPDYKLEPVFNDVFYSELNDEIIFAIQYAEDDPNNSQDFSLEYTWAGVASGVNYPTNNIFAAFVGEDIRYTTTFSPDSVEVGKFITSSNDPELGGNDWIVLRYADVLLMHAESIMAGAASTTDVAALASFNEVRTRAGMPTVLSITKDELLLERRLELAFENHRWFDLERFGVLKSTMEAFATEEGFSFSDTDLVLPIPEQEINISDVWVQNTGY